jgi:hypothetical protein
MWKLGGFNCFYEMVDREGKGGPAGRAEGVVELENAQAWRGADRQLLTGQWSIHILDSVSSSLRVVYTA